MFGVPANFGEGTTWEPGVIPGLCRSGNRDFLLSPKTDQTIHPVQGLYMSYFVETRPLQSTFVSPQIDLYGGRNLAIEEQQAAKDLELKQSIFESYDPLNEAERIQKLSQLSPEGQKYYITENLLSYFEEFAAEIKIKKLAGVIKKDGSMEMLGTNVTEMYTHSAQLAGPGSREVKEKEGLDIIMQSLQSGANRALWISPPKVADYGFGFIFKRENYSEELGGWPFRELLLRYDEDLETIERSKQIYTKMKYSLGMDTRDMVELKTADDFLDKPIVYSRHDNADLTLLNQLMNISEQDVEKSERFRQELLPYIRPMMDEYINLIQHMSHLNLASRDEQLQMYEEQCKVLIGGMFNTARAIQRRMEQKGGVRNAQREQDEAQLQRLAYGSIDPTQMMLLAAQMAAYEELTVMGGSNCLVTRGTGIAEESVIEAMSAGASLGQATQLVGVESSGVGKDACVTCPYCQNKKNNLKIKNKYICGNRRCPSNKKK